MRVSRLGLVLAGGVLSAAVAAGCGGGTDEKGSVFDSGAPDVWSAPVDATAQSDGGSFLALGDSGGILADATTYAPDVNGPLAIATSTASLDVSYGQGSPTATATASVNGNSVAASFSVDRGEIGSIDAASGIFVPTGIVGGVVTITASFGTQQATAQITVHVHMVQNGSSSATATDAGAGDAGPSDAGPSDAGDAGAALDAGGTGGNGGVGGEGQGGPLDSTTQGVLTGTPTTDPSLAFLYPYDQTVWPQGLLAPLLQWSTATNYDGVYIHLVRDRLRLRGLLRQDGHAVRPPSDSADGVGRALVLEPGRSRDRDARLRGRRRRLRADHRDVDASPRRP